jgi:hypothetical protein
MKDNINIYIYMTDANICIKEEIESFIEKYKKGDIFQVDIAIKIAEIVDNIDCFFCLDQKQCWDYRGKKYISDNNKCEYYKKMCPHCLTRKVDNLWIEDCETNDLIGPFDIKLFRHDSEAGSAKFEALEKYVIQKNPELDKPEFSKTSVDSIYRKEKTYKLELEVEKIINICKSALDLYSGNPLSIVNLFKNIKAKITCSDEESEKTNVVCDEINPNQFIYILIKNKSTKKMKSRLGMYSYEKFYLDVQIDIFEIKTLNKSAHYICSNIINRTAERNINDIIKLFQ